MTWFIALHSWWYLRQGKGSAKPRVLAGWGSPAGIFACGCLAVYFHIAGVALPGLAQVFKLGNAYW